MASITEEERREALEHRDVLINLRALLLTEPGKHFVKYLFKNFNVAEPPPEGLKGEILHDMLGIWRAGNSIFKLVCEADPLTAAHLLSQNEKERYENLTNDLRNSQSGQS